MFMPISPTPPKARKASSSGRLGCDATPFICVRSFLDVPLGDEIEAPQQQMLVGKLDRRGRAFEQRRQPAGGDGFHLLAEFLADKVALPLDYLELTPKY